MDLAEARAGRDGGYRLTRQPHEVALLEVVEAAEGPFTLERCILRGHGGGTGPWQRRRVRPGRDGASRRPASAARPAWSAPPTASAGSSPDRHGPRLPGHRGLRHRPDAAERRRPGRPGLHRLAPWQRRRGARRLPAPLSGPVHGRRVAATSATTASGTKLPSPSPASPPPTGAGPATSAATPRLTAATRSGQPSSRIAVSRRFPKAPRPNTTGSR